MTAISSLGLQLALSQLGTAVLLLSPSLGIYLSVKAAGRRGYATYPILLFLGSYLPLHPILFWQTLDQQYTIFGTTLPIFTFARTDWSIFAILSMNLFTVAVIYQGMVLILARGRAGQPRELTIRKDITPVANEYILVYIYPLLLLDYTKLFDITVFLIVFASIAIIQARTDRYMINPVLVFFGYYFYHIEIDGDNAFLLSRRDLDEGDTDEMSQISISDNVRVHTGRT